MVWPVHCELGSWGHDVHAAVRRAYHRWEDAAGINAEKFLKGLNPFTEHYSAIRAEVPDPASPGTLVNNVLLDRLASAGEILVAGEAGRHCVKATVEDIILYRPATAARRVLPTDCMSPVAEFAHPRAATVADLDEIALGAVVVAQPEPPAGTRPPGPGGRTTASGNTRSPPGARPVRHARYVRLPGEKTGVPGEKTGVPGEKTSVLGKNTKVLGKNTKVLGKNTKVLGKNLKVLGKNTKVFGKNTKVFGKNLKVFGKNTKVFGARL